MANSLISSFLLTCLAVASSPVPQQHQPLPGVAVDRRLARVANLAVGDTARLVAAPGDSGRAFVVRALYEARPDPATVLRGEYQVRLHLPDLASLLGQPDRIDRIGVASRPGVPAESLAAVLNRTAFGYRAYPSATIAAESSRTFLVVSRFHRAIGFIAILASAVFLLCIMLLKVEERRLDAAVMRMVGISRRTVLTAVVLEACLVAALGSVLGVGLAAVAGLVTNTIYGRKFETGLVFSVLTPDIVAAGVALSLGLGLAVGSLAAGRLVRTSPLALWRRDR